MNKKELIVTGVLLSGTFFIPALSEAQSNSPKTTTSQQTIEVVSFEDPNLEIALRETLNIPTADITSTDMETLRSLNINNKAISSLKGLEYATNLTTLYLNENQIADISPLENLTKLTLLHLNNNQIEDLSPLSRLENLTNLQAINNRILSLNPLKQLTKLTYLHLGGNQIKDLTPIESLINLDSLFLTNNQITNLSPLSNLFKLEYLYLNDNQIEDITPLEELTKLNVLVLNWNQITDISPLSNLVNLSSLGIVGNQIEDISVMTNLKKIKSISFYSNKITDISPLANTNLESFEIHANAITDFSPMKDFPNQFRYDMQNATLSLSFKNNQATNPFRHPDGSYAEIINLPTGVTQSNDLSTLIFDTIEDGDIYTFRTSFATAKITFVRDSSQLPATLTMNGTIEPTVLSIQVPNEVSFTINPNLPSSIIAPTFELINETVTPLTVEVETISTQMGNLTLTPLTTYTDEEWLTLPKNQAHQIGLGLSTSTGMLDLSNNNKQTLGILSNTQPLELSLVVKHGRAISTTEQLSLTLRFTFGLLD